MDSTTRYLLNVTATQVRVTKGSVEAYGIHHQGESAIDNPHVTCWVDVSRASTFSHQLWYARKHDDSVSLIPIKITGPRTGFIYTPLWDLEMDI